MSVNLMIILNIFMVSAIYYFSDIYIIKIMAVSTLIGIIFFYCFIVSFKNNNEKLLRKN